MKVTITIEAESDAELQARIGLLSIEVVSDLINGYEYVEGITAVYEEDAA